MVYLCRNQWVHLSSLLPRFWFSTPICEVSFLTLTMNIPESRDWRYLPVDHPRQVTTAVSSMIANLYFGEKLLIILACRNYYLTFASSSTKVSFFNLHWGLEILFSFFALWEFLWLVPLFSFSWTYRKSKRRSEWGIPAAIMADQHNVRVVLLSIFFDVDCMHMLCYDAFLWRRLRALWKYNELAWTNQNQILC